MTFILKLKSLSNADLSESLFLAGTTLSEQTATSFSTVAGDYTVHFTGRNLTYDAAGMITGGQIDEYRLYQGGLAIEDQIIIVSSNPSLMSGQFLADVFALYDAGRVAAANALVMDHWTQGYYSVSDYSADDLHGTRVGDFLSSPLGGNVLSGLQGDDTMLMGTAGGQGFGGEGNDVLYSNTGFDQLYGGLGDDQFISYSRRLDKSVDAYYGGLGDDRMGGRGLLDGGAGNDSLMGGAVSKGGDGADVITAGRKGSVMQGGAGADTVTGDAKADHAYGGGQNDVISGLSGDDVIQGDGGDDLLFGGNHNDQLTGGTGNDTAYGGTGDDLVSGGDGMDRLDAGAGINSLIGGAGSDVFAFAPGVSTDTIQDFDIGRDSLDLKRFHFTDLAAVLADTGGGDALFSFAGGQSLLVLGVTAADLLADVIL